MASNSIIDRSGREPKSGCGVKPPPQRLHQSDDSWISQLFHDAQIVRCEAGLDGESKGLLGAIRHEDLIGRRGKTKPRQTGRNRLAEGRVPGRVVTGSTQRIFPLIGRQHEGIGREVIDTHPVRASQIDHLVDRMFMIEEPVEDAAVLWHRIEDSARRFARIHRRQRFRFPGG